MVMKEKKTFSGYGLSVLTATFKDSCKHCYRFFLLLHFALCIKNRCPEAPAEIGLGWRSARACQLSSAGR